MPSVRQAERCSTPLPYERRTHGLASQERNTTTIQVTLSEHPSGIRALTFCAFAGTSVPPLHGALANRKS